MTKDEFIQEAALRILARDSESSMISIADYAAELADEVWKRFDSTQPIEPEVLTVFPDGDSVQVVAKEIARLEALHVKEKAATHRYAQKGGLDIRFLNVCRWYGGVNIDTVKDLIDCGRANFSKRHNMGPKTMKLLDQALENLYNIKSW